MEPTEALATLEVGLRSLILERLGAEWLQADGAPTRERLQGRLVNEQKRRHGAVVSSNLLDYTMTPDLGRMISANWDAFAPVFESRERFRALMSVVEDVRNSVAHSRDLLPFERELLSGIAGYVSNSVALHRGSLEGPGTFYPLIETVTDHLGNDLSIRDYNRRIQGPRLTVGDTVAVRGTSTPTRGVELVWSLAVGHGTHYSSFAYVTLAEARGSSVDFKYRVQEDDVSEDFWVEVRLSTESRYHRYMESMRAPYDDVTVFTYPIRPPYGV